MNLTHENFVSLTRKAMSLAAENQFGKSEEIFCYLIENFPSHGELSLFEVTVLNNMAFLCQRKGDFHRALALLSRAYTYKPLCEQEISYFLATLMNLSTVNYALGNHQQSLQQAFRAIELCDKENCVELKVTAHYNLSSILTLLNRVTKAGIYFRETINLSKNLLGSKHRLTVLSLKASSACLNTENFHVRVKSSGYSSKNSSFTTSTSRVTKYYVGALENDIGSKLKINFSTKIEAINKTGKNILHKESMMGLPYVREIKNNIRIDASLFKSPKKDLERQQRIKKMSNTLYLKSKKLDDRIKRINDFILALEDQLEHFKSECRKLSDWAEFPKEDEKLTQAAVTIQKWFRSHKN